MHKPGAITKISVTDFVTYRYAELYPGENLNMLVGPNGSGKSTMVAAIILGLGGSPKTVGRGKRISEYVKYNCEKSTIVIQLRGQEPGDFVTITREFDKTDRSTWKLNATKKTHKEIIEYIRLYKIQVDNLCQFLPQDKVADFAKLNKQELLKQTQVALCRDDLVEQQNDLVQSRDRHKYLLTNLELLQTKLKQMTDSALRLEGKVDNFRKKMKFVAQKEGIVRKKAWVRHFNLFGAYEVVKRRQEDAKRKYDKVSSSAKPMKDAMTKLQNASSSMLQKEKNFERELTLLENSVRLKNESLRSHRDAEAQINSEKEAKLRELEMKGQEIAKTKLKLDQILNDRTEMMQNYGNDDKITEKLQSLNTDLRTLTSNIMKYDERKDNISRNRQQKEYEIRSLENELSQIQNIKNQRLNYLRQVDDNAYQATMWLRQNRHLFEGEVYEPIMLEINVLNPDYALYVENSIAFRDKVAFTCTNKDDMNLLIRSLNVQKNLRVNVLYSDDRPNTQFQPHYPIEQLCQFGFQAYIPSLFTAPGPIMNYLCKTNGIHNVPVSFHGNVTNVDEIPREIRVYYKGKYRVGQSISKYSRQKIIKQNQISSDKTLSLTYDQLRVQNVQGQLEELRRQTQSLVDQIRNLDEQITEMNERGSKCKDRMRQLREVRQKHEAIEGRIQILKDKIRQMEASNVTREEIEQKCEEEMNELALKVVSKLKDVKKSFEAFTKKQIEFNINQANLDIARRRIVHLENAYQDLRSTLEEVTASLNEARENFKNITLEVKVSGRKARDLSGGFEPEEDGFKAYRREYEKLSNDYDELSNEEEMLASKIECLLNAADQAEMNEYENQLKQIKVIQRDIENENDELVRITCSMDAKLAAWLEPLQELIGKINKRFSSSFASMGCVGEVNLYKGNDEKDFEEYGISISVTYRNGEPLQELNNVVQSGGERAVATAAYMLSLQELTPVPFRCVDEVNQGMDASNERRIFELLVDITSKPDTSQYFLITPKLIPNLKYVPAMKIHFVHNGPFLSIQDTRNS